MMTEGEAWAVATARRFPFMSRQVLDVLNRCDGDKTLAEQVLDVALGLNVDPLWLLDQAALLKNR